MSLHVSHHTFDSAEEVSENHDESEEIEGWYHIIVGFPVSVIGAMVLILAEKQQTRE